MRPWIEMDREYVMEMVHGDRIRESVATANSLLSKPNEQIDLDEALGTLDQLADMVGALLESLEDGSKLNICPICGSGATEGFVARTVQGELRVRLACGNHEMLYELPGVPLEEDQVRRALKVEP